MEILLLIVLAAWFIGTTVSIAYENAWAASFTLVIAVTVGALFYGLSATFAFIAALPFTWFGVISVILGYLIIGVLWSFFKFFRHVRNNKAQYKERGLQEVDKATIATWITYWPFSLIVYVLGDLVREAVNQIVNQFKGVYKYIMQKALQSK